jgi:ATP-dependent metalloprotease FtsH
MPIKELVLGIAGGLAAFCIANGIDILPLFFLLSLLAGIVYMNPARRNAKSFAATLPGSKQPEKRIEFDDIGGQEIAKNELREALEFVKDIHSITKLGIRPLKGILLSGPPGTGKTLLAKAAAQYTQSAFLSASGSEFVEMYVGVGAQRVRQLFNQARQLAVRHQYESAVIFIDEIEVLGGKRGQTSGNLEYDQTLNELLVQMDGLSLQDSVRILIIGATNRTDMLDPALLRPGRFDRQVKVELPDKKGRLHILQLHTRNKPLAFGVDLENLAAQTFGFSGAHLESLTNEAAILALRQQQSEITANHFSNAIDKVLMGEKMDKLPNPMEKRRIAVHEAGHALLSELMQTKSVASINIASRSNALGYVRQTPPDDIYLYTFTILKGRIAVALAGAVAEEITLGSRSTGAANDFKQAVEMAKQIIYGGMSTLGIISPDDLPKNLLHETLSLILKESETFVKNYLETNAALLDRIVTVLLEQESISGEDFRQLLASYHCM